MQTVVRLIVFLLVGSAITAAQAQPATPATANEQALAAKLMKEIGEGLTCNASVVTLQAEIVKLQAKIKELTEPKEKPKE